MYDMNLLQERVATGASFRTATRWLFVLGLAAILVHTGNRAQGVWKAERARSERSRVAENLAARERVVEHELAARTQWMHARATRVLWGPSLTTLSQLLPSQIALSRITYERAGETVLLHLRGGATEDRSDFLRLLRVDPILAQSFSHYSIIEENGDQFTVLAEVKVDR